MMTLHCIAQRLVTNSSAGLNVSQENK